MKLSKVIHILSVIAGVVGIVMVPLVLFAWPANASWLGITREMMLLCSILALIAAIWLQIATIHHIILEKRGEII